MVGDKIKIMKIEKVAVTVITCIQIGMDTWKDVGTTKVFDQNSSIGDILIWARTIGGKSASMSTIKITDVVE